MTPVKVAFAGSFAVRLVEPVRARLGIPCEIAMGDEAEILPALADADVLVSMSFTRAMADAGNRLRLIQVAGAGLDRIDRSAIRPDMQLANAYGHETGIAEYIIGAMLSLTRNLSSLDTQLRLGKWDSQWAVGSPAPPLRPELAGKTLGIVGFGHIGEALARRARAFDMQVVAIRRQAQPEPLECVSFIGGPERLDEVLRASDYLAITLSLSPETRGLLDERRLGLMRPTAYLINVARAEIVDETALYRALSTGALAGAALDVWWRYPTAPGPLLPSVQPFHELPNVIMTPHASGWTEGMLEARAKIIADNIARTARGEPPVNAIAWAG
jgi:phosphoglycerate dehydrogenase-like enzyme